MKPTYEQAPNARIDRNAAIALVRQAGTNLQSA
jgi:hypothetical protein